MINIAGGAESPLEQFSFPFTSRKTRLNLVVGIAALLVLVLVFKWAEMSSRYCTPSRATNSLLTALALPLPLPPLAPVAVAVAVAAPVAVAAEAAPAAPVA